MAGFLRKPTCRPPIGAFWIRMQCTTVTLPLAHTWDAAKEPAEYIRSAEFAVLRDKRVELVLGQSEYGPAHGLRTMHLCYAGHEGLHYDADSHIRPRYLEMLIQSDEADITDDWARCETYLREQAAGLPNH